jgi:hypothetical protein
MNSTEAILQLHPAADQAALLEDYAERYAEAANWLSQKVFDAGVTDQVRLHRLYYNRLRDRFELPAQAAVLCLKHVARLCRKAVVAPRVSADGPVPFDRHLYSMKSVDAVSLSTLAGRVVVPCTLSTYAAGEFLVGSAELCRFDRDWVFILRTELPEDLLHCTRRFFLIPAGDPQKCWSFSGERGFGGRAQSPLPLAGSVLPRPSPVRPVVFLGQREEAAPGAELPPRPGRPTRQHQWFRFTSSPQRTGDHHETPR